jgi:hypothetical protein
MKKSKLVPRRKRPRSVLAKAWVTRRKNAAAKGVNKEEFLRKLDASLRLATEETPPATQTPRSEAWGVLRDVSDMLHANMTEQLCSFVGDMAAIEHMRPAEDHHPVMVSWPQARAVQTFLHSHGFTSFGYKEHLDISKMKKAA